MSARDELFLHLPDSLWLSKRDGLIDAHRDEVRREILGDDLNPSRLVLDAQAYRRLADDVLATMANPDRWDLDGAEEWILAQYVQHIAAQLTLASEFRVPLSEGIGGGYGEIVVQRESTDSDRWAVTDGAFVGLQAWIDGDGWKYVTDIGRAAAFTYGLDEALALADEVARFEQERHDARIGQGATPDADRVVAYRDPRNPRVLLCREHGERWQGVVPVTSDDLPDGGICTFGRLSSLTCGRDVLTGERRASEKSTPGGIQPREDEATHGPAQTGGDQ